jgi:hypothetical protein
VNSFGNYKRFFKDQLTMAGRTHALLHPVNAFNTYLTNIEDKCINAEVVRQ